MEHIKPFYGSKEEGYQLALRDKDQYIIKEIISYRGDVFKRTTIELLVEFEDGDIVWLPFSNDISSTKQFESFCKLKAHLTPLLYTDKIWKNMMKTINNTPILNVEMNMRFYLNLRYYGDNYYQKLDLPNKDTIDYMVECRYIRWLNKEHTSVKVECMLFNEKFNWNTVTVYLYGGIIKLMDKMFLIDGEFIRKYPKIMEGWYLFKTKIK